MPKEILQCSYDKKWLYLYRSCSYNQSILLYEKREAVRPRRALQLPLIFIVMCLKYVRIGKAKLFVVMKWRITLWGYN